MISLFEIGENETCERYDIKKSELLGIVYNFEKEINRKLILQNQYTGKIELTKEGTLFSQYARRGINMISTGYDLITNDNNNYDIENNIVLGISKDSISSWALDCLQNFNKIHPGLRLSIIADDMITQDMINKSSIIFWCLEDNESIKEFDRIWYIEYKYGLFASLEYIENYGNITLENIHNHRVIAYDGKDSLFSYRNSNWHINGKYGLPILNPSIFSSSREMMSMMIAKGLGIGSVCDSQELYYGYNGLKRIIPHIEGPILKNYFLCRRDILEQQKCNIELISSLFHTYFKRKNVWVYDDFGF